MQIEANHNSHFVETLKQHARRSKATEPGIKRFEFYQDPADPNRIWFHEAYWDEAALRAHLQGEPHTKRQEPSETAAAKTIAPRVDSGWATASGRLKRGH